ncbi:MAG TPA: alkaline phosphatase PhoX, partial [Polyangiales bacterium]|nr:alkaline phosphatase PhoX [Polyangiales bacterium]
RRNFLHGTGAVIAAGSLSQVIQSRASAQGLLNSGGYGALIPDPDGILDLPAGFTYRIFSREGELLSDGHTVPGCHDGMAAFSASFFGDFLVRNHEINPEDAEEDGIVTVAQPKGLTYDPEGAGGTTTLLVHRGRVLQSKISLAGTLDNCAGGPTPWGTWLTCEENTDTLSKPHGYIFEVDPWRGGNPEPIKAMGRFEHEAVAFGRDGSAYLTEDTSEPYGLIYRYQPTHRLRGRGSLHAGGVLTALQVEGVTVDLSEVVEPGTVLPVKWVEIANVDPGDKDTSTREQGIGKGATPIQKAEGAWRGRDGSIWFTASYAVGPTPEDPEDAPTVNAHKGQIWKYDPRRDKLELVAIFPVGVAWDGPDNITVGPHGFAVACTDGDGENFLLGISDDGKVWPLARNANGDDEFTGATFSPDGRTLYANIQGIPAFSIAITGPWR